jgi:streptomycin 6-kinase
MTVEQRLANCAREWRVSIDETRATETSLLGFGTRGSQPVVLKIIRKENSEEWRCGEVLDSFSGLGMILPIVQEPGAVLLPRLVPGNDLVSLSLQGRDDEATEVIASLIQRMSGAPVNLVGDRPVDQLQSEFAKFRDGAHGFIPLSYVDRAEAIFRELCATQRNVRLLHGDLHHYNVLFDQCAGWVVIDPWGVMCEIEFEIGAALRNPVDAPALLGDSRVMERRLRIFEATLDLHAERALKWAFATTVLGILWPADPETGLDMRASFAAAAHSMLRLLE